MVKQVAFCHLFQGDSVNTFFKVFHMTFLKVFAETFFKVRWIPFSRFSHQSVRKQLHVKLFQVRLCSFGEAPEAASAFVGFVPTYGEREDAPLPRFLNDCWVVIEDSFSLVVACPIHLSPLTASVPNTLVPFDLFQGLCGEEVPDLLQGALSASLSADPGDDPDIGHLQDLFQGVQVLFWNNIVFFKTVVPVDNNNWLAFLFQGRFFLFLGTSCNGIFLLFQGVWICGGAAALCCWHVFFQLLFQGCQLRFQGLLLLDLLQADQFGLVSWCLFQGLLQGLCSLFCPRAMLARPAGSPFGLLLRFFKLFQLLLS